MSVIDRLRTLVAHHATMPRTPTAIPGLMLFRSSSCSVPANTIYRSRLYLIVQGSKEVVLGRQVFLYDDSHYLITTVDLPVRSAVMQASPDRPYLALSLDFHRPYIADLLLDFPHARAPRSKPKAGLAVAQVDETLLAAVLRLATLLETPDDIPVLAPLLQQEIYYRLLKGPLGGTLQQIAIADSYVSQISRVMAWIRQHHATAFEIADLARIAGMSAASLFRHFKAVALMSPIQYRTQVRLQEARRRLLAEDEDAAAVGFAVGYESPSQFSRDYRRMFGVPPVRDTARIREEMSNMDGVRESARTDISSGERV